jgi:hypothetical protein
MNAIITFCLSVFFFFIGWRRYDNHISLNAEAFSSTGFTLAIPVMNEALIRECIQVVIDQNIFPRAALPA